MINIEEFEKLELRVGTIRKAENFPKAKKPAYKLRIDFGSFGRKWASAQITENYSLIALVGRRIIAAMNLGNKVIGTFKSEVLVMGAEDNNGNIVLIEPDRDIENGSLVD
jgi:tRNA-binding protein